MSDIYLFLAEGFEEIEALTPVDILRRAGLSVSTVAVGDDKIVAGSHGIKITADISMDEVDWEHGKLLILPGGQPGTRNLEVCGVLVDNVKAYAENGKLIAAICAAPSILGHLGILDGKKACCFPGMESELGGAEVLDVPSVIAGNIITGAGMGCAMEFALDIVEVMLGAEKRAELRTKVVYDRV